MLPPIRHHKIEGDVIVTSGYRKNDKYGYIHLHPIPNDENITTFYEKQYYDLIQKGGRAPEIQRLMNNDQQEIDWLNHTLYRDIADYLNRLNSGRRLLDIGAGTGHFIRTISKFHFEAEGIDPSQHAAAEARRNNLKVATADLEVWATKKENIEAYDVVTLLNVLEHVVDAEKTLRFAAKLLTPEGIVCVRVPNDFSDLQKAAAAAIGCDQWWVSKPDHINYFSAASLSSLLIGVGFDLKIMTADFPIELFLLMGKNYVNNPSMGAACHEQRRNLEMALPTELRQKMYHALASVGCGRSLLAFGRLKNSE